MDPIYGSAVVVVVVCTGTVSTIVALVSFQDRSLVTCFERVCSLTVTREDVVN